MLPSNPEELADLYREAHQVLVDSGLRNPYAPPTALREMSRIAGLERLLAGSHWILDKDRRDKWRAALRREIAKYEGAKPAPGTFGVSLRRMRHIVEHQVADQVVVAQGGIRLLSLQEKLAKEGQCLPYLPPCAAESGRLHWLIGYNLPHLLEGPCGSWRDWILGMKVVLADGTIANCGSKVVKSVAGYDVQKLFVGARGTLGTIVEVTLRTFPLKALPETNASRKVSERWDVTWIQRAPRSDFSLAVREAGDSLRVADPDTGTLWCAVDPASDLSRYEGDWVIRRGCEARNVPALDPVQVRLMRRTKELFDPNGKLNPGDMGIF